MARLTDDEWEALVRGLADRVAAVAPDWTDQPDHDPGVTVVELVGFLAESLLAREARSSRVLTRLRDVRTERDAARAFPCSDLPPLTRPRFFAGQLLAADDFEAEQRYVRDRLRRHNLLLHGIGVVAGLEVTVESGTSGEESVVVSPGLALGPDGEELVVCDPLTSPPCVDAASCHVTLHLVERPRRVGPGPAGEEASRVEETVAIDVVPDGSARGLVIGRVVRADDAWQIDAAFRRPTVVGSSAVLDR